MLCVFSCDLNGICFIDNEQNVEQQRKNRQVSNYSSLTPFTHVAVVGREKSMLDELRRMPWEDSPAHDRTAGAACDGGSLTILDASRVLESMSVWVCERNTRAGLAPVLPVARCGLRDDAIGCSTVLDKKRMSVG